MSITPLKRCGLLKQLSLKKQATLIRPVTQNIRESVSMYAVTETGRWNPKNSEGHVIYILI